MKAYKTLLFFVAVVLMLAALCVVYPKDGIGFGKKDSLGERAVTLRFASLDDILVHEEVKTFEELIYKHVERNLDNARDSIEDCRKIIFEEQIRIHLPNNDIRFFDKFFDKAGKVAQTGKIIRILHYGDSQIEQDRISCRLRERMQQYFGGGGPGLLPLRQPIPTISFNQSASGALYGQSTYGDSTMRRADGNYGPMMRSWRVGGEVAMSLNATTNKMAADGVHHFSTLRILFNNRPGPLNVTMTNRKPSAQSIANGTNTFSKSVSEPGIHMISWQMDSSTSSASIRVSGSADVYGVLVDDGPGVAVDNISMRGVSGHQFKMVNFDQLAKAYSLMDIGIIIMQFGGNSVPYLRTDKAIDSYCENMGKQIDYVHEACPDAAILFIGPSDMCKRVDGKIQTYPKLPSIVEKLRITANEHGAAFWSIYDAMGGHNSMITWFKEGYAGEDYVHFTHKGANIMGDYLCEILMKLYELYIIRNRMSPEEFNKLWNESKAE